MFQSQKNKLVPVISNTVPANAININTAIEITKLKNC